MRAGILITDDDKVYMDGVYTTGIKRVGVLNALCNVMYARDWYEDMPPDEADAQPAVFTADFDGGPAGCGNALIHIGHRRVIVQVYS